MSVCVVSLDYLYSWQVHVSVYCARRILGAPSDQSCCTLWISTSYRIYVCIRLVCAELLDLI